MAFSVTVTMKTIAMLLVIRKVSCNLARRAQDVPLCHDKDPQCYRYPDHFCSTLKDWGKANCAAYCGHCDAVSDKRMCSDQVDCASYGCDVCQRKPAGWLDANCPMYCRRYFCLNRPPPGAVGTCKSSPKSNIPLTQVPSLLPTPPKTSRIPPTAIPPTLYPATKAPPTALPSTVIATTNLPCEDLLDDCAADGKTVCTSSINRNWAEKNCRKYCGFCKIQTTTSLSPTCSDALAGCAEYGKEVCVTHRSWAQQNCNKFCGFCTAFASTTTVAIATTTKVPCVDLLNDCAADGRTICTSPFSRHWAEKNCRKYCGFCTEPIVLPTRLPCIDVQNNCADYGQSVCGNYKSWAKENCRNYCNLC